MKECKVERDSSQFIKCQLYQEQPSSKGQPKFGKWDQQQSEKYVVFLDFYQQKINSRKGRQNFDMFNILAKFMVTRTSTQCRSHHQKLLLKFSTLAILLKNMKKLIGKDKYPSIYSQYKPILIQFDQELKESRSIFVKKDQGTQTDLYMENQQKLNQQNSLYHYGWRSIPYFCYANPSFLGNSFNET